MFRRPEALAVCPPGGDPRERGMFLNQTTNYGLTQWEATDRILMEDFNSDNKKVDTALTGLDGRTEVLESAVQGFGNCQIQVMSYQGDGATSRTFTFSGVPRLVIFLSYNSHMTAISNYSRAWGHFGGTTVSATATWNGNCLTLSSSSGQEVNNLSGTAYQLAALIEQGAAQ